MHFEPIDRFDNARCVTVCDSVKDQSNPINRYLSNLSSTQPEFKSIIDQLLSLETSKIRINHNVQCNLNNLIDLDTEPDTVSKDKISPKQNDTNKRSPLAQLHEEPNAQEIPPRRYLSFINHTG